MASRLSGVGKQVTGGWASSLPLTYSINLINELEGGKHPKRMESIRLKAGFACSMNDAKFPANSVYYQAQNKGKDLQR